jgi:hypothetical protein
MRSRADICRQKADECERAATRVADPQVQAGYRQMSRKWHQIAEQQRAIDEALAGRRKPPEWATWIDSAHFVSLFRRVRIFLRYRRNLGVNDC